MQPFTTKMALRRLHPRDDINARKGNSKDGIAELVASIKAHGLLQPIRARVRSCEDGSPDVYEIVDGRRRYEALRKLYGKKADDVEIDVVVDNRDDAAAREASLAANVVRLAMHPVDEFDGYKAMIDAGATPETVAERFGVKVAWVRQRLQLAALAPELRAAWRAGAMGEEQAVALSCVPDHERQAAVWKKATKNKADEWSRRPDALRCEMRESFVDSDDGRVKFIGVEPYVAAGGRIANDLFAAKEILLDEPLLDKLVDEALLEVCKKFVADGWAWAKPESQFDGPTYNLKTLDVSPWFTPEEAKLVAANKKFQAIYEAESAAKERAINDPKARALSGVVLSIGGDGEIDVERLVLEDQGDKKTSKSAAPAPEPTRAPVEDDEPEADRVNWTLREKLSEQLTVALSRALVDSPSVAVAALHATLATRLHTHNAVPLQISTERAWNDLLPEIAMGDNAPRWVDAFKRVSDGQLVDPGKAIASLVAMLLDFRRPQFDRRDGWGWEDDCDKMAAALAAALPANDVQRELSMAFDAGGYFKSVNADACEDAIREMGGRDKKPAKKAALVGIAVALQKTTGWLPTELRTAHYVGPATIRKARKS